MMNLSQPVYFMCANYNKTRRKFSLRVLLYKLIYHVLQYQLCLFLGQSQDHAL